MNTEVLEGNKLIAEFMGYKLVKKKTLTYKYWEKPIRGEFGDDIDVLCSEYKLIYHTSWDWLMPVLQKIAKLVIEEDWGNRYNQMMTRWKVISHCLTELKHDEIYDATLLFIKWYNQQPNTKNT